MSSERTTHNPSTQTIKVSYSETHFIQIHNSDGTSKLMPMPVYMGFDYPSEEVRGPFLTQGACDWCLACIDNVRESQAQRNGRTRYEPDYQTTLNKWEQPE
jgi:hypothetical protein